jgi:hypothetical protein
MADPLPFTGFFAPRQPTEVAMKKANPKPVPGSYDLCGEVRCRESDGKTLISLAINATRMAHRSFGSSTF